MYALLLAAGRGERMRPLTDETPKPLLQAGPCSLIEHRIRALVEAGIVDIVINHSHLGDRITATLGDGGNYGAHIRYSPEPEGALETGGGIVQALRLLDSDPFIVINADIWCDLPCSALADDMSDDGRLVLVDNPAHNRKGDFVLVDERVRNPAPGKPSLTFSGIGVYRHDLFAQLEPGRFPLGPVLRRAAARDQLSGMHYRGYWTDVGTPQRLAELRQRLVDEN